MTLMQTFTTFPLLTSLFLVAFFTLRRACLPFFTICIRVDDIDAMVTRVEEHGGYIVDPPIVIDSGSRICLFSEPSGVILAMYEPAKAKEA